MCRTYNGYDINAEPGVNPQMKDGRGNLAPVTIILPTLAMLATEKTNTDIVAVFLKILDTKIHEAKDMLLERFNHMCSQPAEAAKFMYENRTMLGYKPEEGIISALKHGTLVIGQLGLAETLQILINCDHTDSKGLELAEKFYNEYGKKMLDENKPVEDISLHCLSYIYSAIDDTVIEIIQKYGDLPIVFSGGVMSNSIIRNELQKKYDSYFAEPQFSADNACGVAVLASICNKRKL